MRVAQDAAAYSQDHGPMALDQGRERQLGRLAIAAGESLQELTIRQFPDRPQIEEYAKLPDDSPMLADRHVRDAPRAVSIAFYQ